MKRRELRTGLGEHIHRIQELARDAGSGSSTYRPDIPHSPPSLRLETGMR